MIANFFFRPVSKTCKFIPWSFNMFDSQSRPVVISAGMRDSSFHLTLPTFPALSSNFSASSPIAYPTMSAFRDFNPFEALQLAMPESADNNATQPSFEFPGAGLMTVAFHLSLDRVYQIDDDSLLSQTFKMVMRAKKVLSDAHDWKHNRSHWYPPLPNYRSVILPSAARPAGTRVAVTGLTPRIST